jgi:hypothetical protein
MLTSFTECHIAAAASNFMGTTKEGSGSHFWQATPLDAGASRCITLHCCLLQQGLSCNNQVKGCDVPIQDQSIVFLLRKSYPILFDVWINSNATNVSHISLCSPIQNFYTRICCLTPHKTRLFPVVNQSGVCMYLEATCVCTVHS